jgi:hypothetical protein
MSGAAREILFEDSLDGSTTRGWRVPPDRFVDLPEHGWVYLLDPGVGSTVENPPWVGDETWGSYRIEFDVCTTGEKDGWVGPDFHVKDDGSDCCNLQFYSTRERDDILFESSARFGPRSLAWKFFPMAQRSARLPKGVWAAVRADVGGAFANVYVNGDPEPCYTVRYLPFARGGIRLWNYYGSAFFRNLRVTALQSSAIGPALPDPWEKVANGEIVRGFRLSPVLPAGTETGAVMDDGEWIDAPTDARGIVVVSAAGPAYASEKGVVFARATLRSAVKATRRSRLTYTDRLTMWVNGREVFRGEPRGWFDPGRSLEDWFGRLVPNQFETELPLDAGGNEILVRLEINEPFFGSGFWLRLA